jgi:hypothetical protein
MAFFAIRANVVINAIIIVFAFPTSCFLFLFGGANLLSPDVPEAYLEQNNYFSIAFCLGGLLLLAFTIAAFRGIRESRKKDNDGSGA